MKSIRENRPLLLTLLTIALLLVPVLSYYCYTSNTKSDIAGSLIEREHITLSLGDGVIFAGIADSIEERIQGLSGRPSLEEDGGLLFVFSEANFHGIWMKEMHFPIDILWMDEDFRIIHIEEGVAPETFPRVFRPDAPAWYVLEVISGTVARINIKIGDIVLVED